LRIFVFNILQRVCLQNIEPLGLKSQGIENKRVEGGNRFSVLSSALEEKAKPEVQEPERSLHEGTQVPRNLCPGNWKAHIFYFASGTNLRGETPGLNLAVTGTPEGEP
jgi:hypothetical protein